MKTPTIIRAQPLPRLATVAVTRRRSLLRGAVAIPLPRKSPHVRRSF